MTKFTTCLLLTASAACAPQSVQPAPTRHADPAPRDVDSTHAVDAELAELEALHFPTFEPFAASRMWKFIAVEVSTESGPDYAEQARGLRELIGAPGESSSEMAREELDPEFLWCMVPPLLIQLEPLWNSEDWTLDAREFAQLVGYTLNEIDSSASFEFRASDQADPALELRRIVRWFNRQIEDPQSYGQMIFTMDDGPWLPDSLPPDLALEASEAQQITEQFLLEIGQHPDHGWWMRGVEDGATTWIVGLGHVPDEPFHFGKSPTALGSYGWKINAYFHEYTHLYLSPEYELLFYFTSW